MPPTDLVPLLIAKKDPTKIKASGYLDDIIALPKKPRLGALKQVLVFLLKLTQRTSDDLNLKK